MATQIISVGMALRPSFRALCAKLSVDYVEQRGFLESVFTIDGPPASVRHIRNIADEIYQEEADLKAAEILADAERKIRKHNRWYRRAIRHLQNR
jgi:hypothetical protein